MEHDFKLLISLVETKKLRAQQILKLKQMRDGREREGEKKNSPNIKK